MSRLYDNECADLTERGEQCFHSEPCEASELERLRAENLRLEGEWFVLMADKQLVVREVERLQEKLAILTKAFESVMT